MIRAGGRRHRTGVTTRGSWLSPLRRSALLALLALGGTAPAGCGDFLTDAATRLATEIVREANRLRKSGGSERTFVHHPKASPEGCSGPYGVTFQSSLEHPERGGSLLVRCGDPATTKAGYHFGTTYHLNEVRVPVELRAEKAQGTDLKVTLRKVEGGIDLVAVE